MPKSRSLRDLLLAHELIFLLLVILAGTAGGYGIHLWRVASSESVRISQLTEEIQQTRGDLYRQMKELFDAQFLEDNEAKGEYERYTVGIEQHFRQLLHLAKGNDELSAITNMHAAYNEFLAQTQDLFNHVLPPDAVHQTDLKKKLNGELELKVLHQYESVTRHAENLLAHKQEQVRHNLYIADRAATIILAIPMLLGIALLLFSRTFLQRAIARPIAAVLRATQEISTGKLQHRAPEIGTTELAQLGLAINRMADDLAHSQEALIKSEKQAAQGALVPVLAHNIRNPLASIRATAQVADDPGLDLNIRQSLSDIIATVDRLERWTGALLAYLHPLKPQITSTTLLTLVDGALSLLQAKLKERNIKIDAAELDVSLKADVHLMEQAIYNLLLNAIDASPHNSIIEVMGAEHMGFVSLRITDQGSGIPFTPENTTKNNALTPGPTTKKMGTGLGIPFAFKVCEAHHGTLAFKVGENGGTTVTMSFNTT
ncbi:MAG: HAMP domain-containing histidine kinase [Methylophilales bacterium]|nr:HAMP domain-containing histidine kinase [Methylophilales bacterium]